MLHEDLTTHFNKTFNAEVILHLNILKFYLDWQLLVALSVCFLLDLIMQAPKVQNQSEINHLKFMLVVIVKFLLSFRFL